MSHTKQKIYLETTLFNYYFLIDPERQHDIDATIKLFEEIFKGNFVGCVSPETIREIENNPHQASRQKMLNFIGGQGLEILKPADFPGFEKLTKLYVKAGVVPDKKLADARHIAIATTSGMDILASWNQRHIVRYKTQTIIQAINMEHGLPPLAINTPAEIISYEDEN